MASAPQQSLPLFYNELEPLSSQQHADFKIRAADKAPFLAKQHAVPVTVEEFPLVQRFMPIVFSQGEEPVPLALMGLNEGVNTFFDEDGTLNETNFYVPAYIRRYPYLLARLRPDSDELSLCFDPTSDTVGAFDEGEALFVDGQPSDTTKNILQFNEQFEQAGARTGQFMQELKELDLLIDGEVTIQPDGAAQPFVYRGFMMVDENKLNEMRGDQLRKIVQNGMLPLIYAHLFSLGLMRDIFGRQLRQGKMPEPQLVQPNA
ncbi:SapC family protein [Nostoc ellipsosporum NOK]|uniref:SapC family protein n=1 Tax=Sphingomonas sp. IBVSS2 TaxID=1985172 RepID=UPI000A2E0119|nr:SapC family protein [Sphingomonas sp. IBVSS2]MDF2384627.1 SapC family protein [Nostoc ellipsosporum NOK]OSZ68228.1 multidrug transporter [Sphingomonas sp. IBVSS2]